MLPRSATPIAAAEVPPLLPLIQLGIALMCVEASPGHSTGGLEPDPTISSVLQLVATTHVDAEGLTAPPLLEAGLRAAQRASRSLRVLEVEGGRIVEGPGGSFALPEPSAQGGSPVEALAAPLSVLLEAAVAADGKPGRNEARTAILDGVLRGADRWSSASTGSSRERLVRRQKGMSSGVGIRIGRREDELRVLEVLGDSGAEQAGLRSGDRLVGVDGRSLEGLVVSQILELIRGPARSHVEIRVARGDELLGFEVERRPLEDLTVSSLLLRENVGLLSISHFSQRTADQFRRELAALRRKAELRAILIDLRGNTGGSMLASAGVADLFLREGVLLETLDRKGRTVPKLEPRVDASPEGDVSTPLAVLVDRRTGSSSELLSACLTRHGRGILVGERTFGKNIVGKLHHFPDAELTVKLSSATMHVAGRELEADGLVPDLFLVDSLDDAPDGALAIAAQPASNASLEGLAGLLLAHGEATRDGTLEQFSSCHGVARGLGKRGSG